MAVTIGSVMRHCRNYFERGYYDGECVVKSGALVTPALADGRYIAISGSVFNDGVYKLGTDVLTEETFTGRVWLLSPCATKSRITMRKTPLARIFRKPSANTAISAPPTRRA